MAEKLIKVKILRDFWDKDGERHRSGKVVEIPMESALDGIEAGTLARVKDEKKA